MFTLKERLDKAEHRIKALKENAELKKQGKTPKHKGLEKGPQLREMEAYRTFLKQLGGTDETRQTARVNLNEMLTSTDIIDMVPRVISGEMIEAAEPELLAANLFTKVQAPGTGVTIVVPIIGEIYVTEVAEGQPFNETEPDVSTLENNRLTIDIKKVGVKVSITEEAMTDYTWDIHEITIRKIGRAFARFKEQTCFRNFTVHGHTVFDNAIRDQEAAAGTTGLGIDGQPNNTLSVEDFLDMMLAAISNNHTPTDFFAHPLIWTVFARNSMIGAGLGFGALGGQNVNPSGGTQGSPNFSGLQNNIGNQQFILRPEQVQNRMPVALTVNLTPQVHWDKEKKLFDCYIVDRNNVGVIAQRQEITMDNWANPERDIQYIKAKERYGVGIQDHGLGIMVAKNISAEVSYPKSIPVRVIAE